MDQDDRESQDLGKARKGGRRARCGNAGNGDNGRRPGPAPPPEGDGGDEWYLVIVQGQRFGSPVSLSELLRWHLCYANVLLDTVHNLIRIQGGPGEDARLIRIEDLEDCGPSELELLRVFAENPDRPMPERVVNEIASRRITNLPRRIGRVRAALGDDCEAQKFIRTGPVDPTVSPSGQAYIARRDLIWVVIRYWPWKGAWK